MTSKRIERFGKSNEVAGNQVRSLVNQLIKRVLTVSAGLSPEYGAGVIIHFSPIQRDMLAVGFHGELLQIGGKAFEVMRVRQNCYCAGFKEICIPYIQQSHDNRHVLLKRRAAEMFVHRMKTGQHGVERFRTNGNHGG